jgi:hypothetical protein
MFPLRILNLLNMKKCRILITINMIFNFSFQNLLIFKTEEQKAVRDAIKDIKKHLSYRGGSNKFSFSNQFVHELARFLVLLEKIVVSSS